MTATLVFGLMLFSFACSITPGPNNTLILASGVNFGFWRTVPLLAGVMIGLMAEILALGWGLGGVFRRFPVIFFVLRWGGAAYLLWLAWRMATAKGIRSAAAGEQPMKFWQAFLFQAVNPKAWVISLTVVTTYAAGGDKVWTLLMATVICCLVNAACVTTWAGFGTALRRFLDRPKVLRIFNIAMALLLVVSLYPLLETPALKP